MRAEDASPVRDGTLAKHLFRFESHAGLPEQGEELVLVRTLGMVLLLALNVVAYHWEM
jgi:hypothetical protein